MAAAQFVHGLRQRQIRQIGKPRQDDTGRLAAGMRIDAVDVLPAAIVCRTRVAD
jgi:hypothetical protein